ncbi:MAG: DCC1-like thiol-disulfide oxidoreductase family protein [Natronomonas sp.]
MSDAVFVYDDDCGFCTWCADLLEARGGLDIVGFSNLDDEQRSRLPEDYESCSHLLTDDRVYSCGAAIEQGLARIDAPPGARDIFDFLRQFQDYERFREKLYHKAADNRDLLGQIVSKDPPARRGD